MINKIKLNSYNYLILLTIVLFYSCNEKVDNEIISNSMFMGNEQHTGKYNSLSLKKEPTILWKIKTDGQVISSPTIANDIVYIGSNDHKLYAINALSGAIIWEYKTKGAISSTPLITKGKVMFLSFDGFFYALNQTDGKLEWKFKTGGESVFNVKDYYNGSFKPDFWDFYLSSAVTKDNIVYFGSSDSNIYALDIETGEKIWNYKTEASIHSTPAISNNSIVVGSWDSNVYCLDALTGAEKWSYATGKDTDTYIWLGIQASPSIDNEIVYLGSRDAKFYAFNLKTGDTIWTKDEFDRSWMPSTAAIDEKNIYTGSSDSFNFYSINKKTGTINYATKTNAYTFSSPAIDNEMGYIGSANGRLYGIELASGDIKWEFETIGVKTDTIKIFDDKGVMDVEGYKALTKDITDMPELSSFLDNAFINVGAILSSPVISNQIIYFGSSDGYVYAISNKSQD